MTGVWTQKQRTENKQMLVAKKLLFIVESNGFWSGFWPSFKSKFFAERYLVAGHLCLCGERQGLQGKANGTVNQKGIVTPQAHPHIFKRTQKWLQGQQNGKLGTKALTKGAFQKRGRKSSSGKKNSQVSLITGEETARSVLHGCRKTIWQGGEGAGELQTGVCDSSAVLLAVGLLMEAR